MIRTAALIVRLFAYAVPRSERARWREEWLNELAAIAAQQPGAAARFAIGAPLDVLALRVDGVSAAFQIGTLRGDVRDAWRQLIRRPSHTLAVLACLVVGLVVSIGTFSAIESLFEGDQVGVHERRTLARIFLSYDDATGVETVGAQRLTAEPLSLNDFRVVRELAPASVLESFGGEAELTVTAAGRRGPVSTTGAFASAQFFRALRTETSQGRLFADADDAPEAAPVVVVTDYFWRTQLDAAPDAVGQSILVGGRSFTVIGVTPARFHGMRPLDIGDPESSGVQLWMPLSHADGWTTRPAADEPWINAVGRMRAGVTTKDVQQELSVAAARVSAASPDLRRHATAVVRTHGFAVGDAPAQIIIVLGLVMLLPLTVLGIGCANVANLQLARAAERARELAVRLSLGATRSQLIRLLTLETLARALSAVALALAIILWLIRWLQPFFPTALRVDWRVSFFAIGLAVSVALVTGLMPAWLVLRRTAAGQLKQSAQSGGLGHRRLRAALVVTQVALSLGLLTMTALVMRTVRNMALSAPAALQEQMVAVFNPRDLGLTPTEARTFADTVAARAARDRRVAAVALSTTDLARIAPLAPSAADIPATAFRAVSLVGITPSWLRAMDARMLAGRPLGAADDASVVVISERTAELLSPTSSPLGLMVTLQLGPNRQRTAQVVGVVADIPTRPATERPDPVVYTALAPTLASPFTLRVRTPRPEEVSADLAAVIAAVDPRITWSSLRRGDMRFQDEARDLSTLAYAVGGCGLVALVLSATGLFAVMSYIVTLRRRELGVRVALGANQNQIVSLVLRQALRLVVTGAGVGLALSVPLAFLMRATFVARVDAADPLVYLPTLAVALATGALAAAVPAFRAARLNPIVTLRQE